jgi:hypothetical protein
MPKNTPTTAHERCIQWVQQHSESEPTPRRIEILRWLADINGNPADCARLIALAADLESADQACREFKFDFTNSTK